MKIMHKHPSCGSPRLGYKGKQFIKDTAVWLVECDCLPLLRHVTRICRQDHVGRPAPKWTECSANSLKELYCCNVLVRGLSPSKPRCFSKLQQFLLLLTLYCRHIFPQFRSHAMMEYNNVITYACVHEACPTLPS